MVNENKDIIRVQATEAQLLGTKLRAGMIGFATDTDRMIYRRLDNSVKKGWSDDSKQCLLAGSQTITGKKVFTGGVDTESVLYTEDRFRIGHRSEIVQSEIDTITDGVTNLDPSSTTGILITKLDSTPADNTVGILAGSVPGQILTITCSDASGIQIDDTVSSSAEIWLSSTGTLLNLDPDESVKFIWQETFSGANDHWVLQYTTGSIVSP